MGSAHAQVWEGERVAATAPDLVAANGTSPPRIDDPLPLVRRAVRDILMASPSFTTLDPARRRELAQSMVRVCHAAASLIREEIESDGEVAAPNAAAELSVAAQSLGATAPRRLARAAGGGAPFGSAVGQMASTTKAVLNAISFPQFVTDLINGVFKAMLASSSSQMEAYVQLLNSVATSTEGFADSQMGPARARDWLVEHYPESFELEGGPDDPEELADMTPEERAEFDVERRDRKIRLRSGATPPSEAALRADLGLGESESVPTSGDPERTLLPVVRRKLAKNRQEVLATMVMLGMHRIVVESGRITASMRFHIDTRDALNRDDATRFGLSNTISGSGSFGVGPWGASASVQNTISYVSTSKTQSTEEINADLDLNSSVEINFKSDYVPLNRLASASTAKSIAANTRNPDVEVPALDMEARRKAQLEGERARRRELESDLTSGVPATNKEEMARTAKDADDKRKAAAKREEAEKAEKAKKEGKSPPPEKTDKPAPQPSDKGTAPPPGDKGTAPPPTDKGTSPPPPSDTTVPPKRTGKVTISPPP